MTHRKRKAAEERFLSAFGKLDDSTPNSDSLANFGHLTMYNFYKLRVDEHFNFDIVVVVFIKQHGMSVLDLILKQATVCISAMLPTFKMAGRSTVVCRLEYSRLKKNRVSTKEGALCSLK